MVANLRKWLNEEWLIMTGRYYVFRPYPSRFVRRSPFDSVILHRIMIIAGALSIMLLIPILLTLASLTV